MVKRNPYFPKNENEKRKLVRILVSMRFRTPNPHKFSPCYLTLAQMSEITKFSRTYIHSQLKYYFEVVKNSDAAPVIQTRSMSK